MTFVVDAYTVMDDTENMANISTEMLKCVCQYLHKT